MWSPDTKNWAAPVAARNVEIGTYVERAIESEMSGNVIDLCPVGALTSKPFQYNRARLGIAAVCECRTARLCGFHLYLHTRRNQVLRAVPRDNEELN